jgi:hypothetical protein
MGLGKRHELGVRTVGSDVEKLSLRRAWRCAETCEARHIWGRHCTVVVHLCSVEGWLRVHMDELRPHLQMRLHRRE